MQQHHCDIIVVCLHSHVPKFTELKNWPPNSVWGVATDGMVTKFQTLTSWNVR